MRGVGRISWLVKVTIVFQKAEKGAILSNIVKKPYTTETENISYTHRMPTLPLSSRRTEGR
jgi:hypothetical protein